MNSKSESLFKEHIIRCNVVNYKMMLEKRFSNNETLVENLIKNFPISSIIQKSKKKKPMSCSKFSFVHMKINF